MVCQATPARHEANFFPEYMSSLLGLYQPQFQSATEEKEDMNDPLTRIARV